MKHLYVLFIFFCSCKNDLADIRSLDYNNSPVTIAKSINSIYTDSGIVSLKLISPKMYNFSNMDFPYFEFPESVEIILFDKNKNEDDKMFEDKNIKIVVDKKSFLYLIGTTLEYSGGLNGTGFVFSNPNANRTCGCGESFSL